MMHSSASFFSVVGFCFATITTLILTVSCLRRIKKDRKNKEKENKAEGGGKDKSRKIKKKVKANKRRKREESLTKRSTASEEFVEGSLAVKMLLECEKRCDLIVEEARHNYLRAMDKAFADAKNEIEKCKKKRELEHQRKLARIHQEELEFGRRHRAQVQKELKQTKKRVADHRDEVMAMILSAVTKIEPELHCNVPDLRKPRAAWQRELESKTHRLQRSSTRVQSSGTNNNSGKRSNDSTKSSSTSTTTSSKTRSITSNLEQQQSAKGRHSTTANHARLSNASDDGNKRKQRHHVQNRRG